MRQDGRLQHATTVLLQATLVVGLLSGCGVAARPDDGARDLPHFASQAPSKEMGPFPRLRASTGLSYPIGSACLGATLPSWSAS